MNPSMFLVLLFVVLQASVSRGVSINYGRLGDNLPAPEQVVTLLKSNNIARARIFDADSSVLRAFANSGIALSISVPNEQLQQLASSTAAARSWLDANYAPFAGPSLSVPAISVGNEVLSNNVQYSPFLLPAMVNLRAGLDAIAASGNSAAAATAVSTPHAFGVLSSSSFPPSKGTFANTSAMRPILDFLDSKGAPFMINAYPFFAYSGNPNSVPLEYALFGSSAAGVDDSNTGLHYSNLFDAMVDTVVAALRDAGHPSMSVVVTETGWPSAGDEPGANAANAASYVNGLVARLRGGTGTPMRPTAPPPEAYIFGLFNEDRKPGPTSERNFGLFQPSQAQAYTLKLN